MKNYWIILIAAALCAVSCTGSTNNSEEVEKPKNIVYGIDADGYQLDSYKVERGDTWSKILDNHGITTSRIARLDVLTKEICPLRTIRSGHKYTTFTKRDSLGSKLDYLV